VRALKLKPLEVSEVADPVAAAFGRGGHVAARLDGYEIRRGQVELAYAVEECMNSKDGATILAEAPTGTGKSLAYGVPATHQAARHGRRTVVVTANIALQEQLAGKDLPFLQAALPWPFTFALAKGINNYLCRDAFEDAEGDLLLRGGVATMGADLGDKWEAVRAWAGRTKTGDLSELAFEAPPELRRSFTTTSDDCLGRKCREYDRCLAMAARRAAREADLVVTNYHLFFADLAIKVASDRTAGVLPPYDHVVLDEGHETADIARGFFGFRVTAGTIRWATRLLGGARGSQRKAELVAVDPGLKARVRKAADGLFRRLGALRSSDDYQARLTEPGMFDPGDLPAALEDAREALKRASESGNLRADRREELRKAGDRCEAAAGYVRAAADLERPEEVVYFLEGAERDPVALAMKPIDVSDVLREHLFESEDVRGRVVTSATLSTGGRDGFAHIAGQIGAASSDDLEVESPFVHDECCVLVVPPDLPLPTGKEKDKFPDAVAELLECVARMTGGRLLGLFTSYRVLDVAHRRLANALLPFRVMRQGDAPRTQLARAFREDETSVLLGTSSFWQGVDVPGRALSCVFIDKLPFETPDDPVLSAIADRDRSWFKTYMLPRAVIALKQGVGRLIRTTSDRGAVVVCDRRLVEKPYGRQFIRAMPEMPVSRDLEVIRGYTD